MYLRSKFVLTDVVLDKSIKFLEHLNSRGSYTSRPWQLMSGLNQSKQKYSLTSQPPQISAFTAQ